MLKEGVLLPPSPFESIFLTTSHSDADLENTLEAFHSAFHSIPHE
jgi:Glutamate-1-semialdehyde aminotransferase